jgi:hypothetical protein
VDKQDKLISSLRRHSPHKIRVHCGDDTRDIAVPQRRRRWPSVVEAIEARPWSQLELLDKSGAVLGYVENDAAPADLEELGAGGGGITQGERIAAMVMRGMERAWAFRNEETTQLMQAQGAVVRELTAAMNGLAKLYQAQVEAAAEVATLNAEAANGGQLRELLEAAPQLLQLLPHLKHMLNGAPGKDA